ncbi:hypothetical protein AB3S75_004763 [Citrus x aurantiifolia]
MGTSSNWFNVLRRKFHRKSRRDITIRHSPTPSQGATIRKVPEEAVNCIDNNTFVSFTLLPLKKELAKEDSAAIKIQAIFRAHLARRAFKALRSLVKLQALVRGVCVRRQSRVAMHAMHALVRLQVRVRARQLLSRCSND